MKRRDLVSIINYYKEYYFKNIDTILDSIIEIDSREFAYIDFESEAMLRHIAISLSEFKDWIISITPRDFYHSSAYYLFPSKDMEAKGWEGADLIFDIDLDHIKDYKPRSIYVCLDKEIKIINKDEDCQGKKKKILILDEAGFERAKKETIRLINLLNRDFDIKIGKIKIYFSGGRGYHVHIYDDELKKLESYERMEIKDYITFEGINVRYIRSKEARALTQFFSMILNDDRMIRSKFNRRELDYLRKLARENNIDMFIKYIRKNRQLSIKINDFISNILRIHIDGVVTMDTSRLIRVPYSLHGRTGLVKKEVNYYDIDKFNPLINAVRDDEYKIKLKILYCPKMFWFDDEYGPYKNEEAVIPFSLGIYLINKGMAFGIRKY